MLSFNGLIRSNSPRFLQLPQRSVKSISTISDTELQNAWEWRSKFKSNTINKQWGKDSVDNAGKSVLRYPMTDLLRQLPPIIHPDIKQLEHSNGGILIRSSCKRRSDIWHKLDEMVIKAADLTIPKKLDKDSIKKVRAQRILRDPKSSHKAKEEAREGLRALAELGKLKRAAGVKHKEGAGVGVERGRRVTV